MLPAVLASQLNKGIGDYTKTSFPITNPLFKDAMEKLIQDGIFHEPYVSVRLPFRVSEKQLEGFDAIHQKFPPYVHQQKAFERLVGSDARSTLIATGTGSGKTECFLYPILEYCYHNWGTKGIKALIIYPMNALATDQAKRVAQLIENSPELKGKVTAGMYVGGHVDHAPTVMTPDSIITDHDAMLDNPPDILLTNYKMLDYLLVRPKDAALWRNNKPETLKFIVVDELHTFDGAQGTDLACLLRRLKSRLYTPQGSLCCIGTSATMGGAGEAKNILDYAKNVFGEQFEDDAIITEDRLSAAEFLMNYDISDYTIPDDIQISKLAAATDDMDFHAYLTLAAASWLDASFAKDKMFSPEGQVALGEHLRHHNVFCTLLQLIQNKFISYQEVLSQLQEKYPTLVSWPDKNAGLEALLSLISHARVQDDAGNLRPFLYVQVQLWLRELRRLVAKVDDKDLDFAVSLDLNATQAKHYLPVVNCRECGATGWATYYTPTIRSAEIGSLENFYSAYFANDANIHLLYPCSEEKANMELCPECMHLQVKQTSGHECEECQHKTIFVYVPLLEHKYGQFICPCCHSSCGLSIMGLRSATEISAGLSLLYASKFNNDKKLLAFSDNVQDAALRAGFFNARTWHVYLRMAIQKYLADGGAGLSLFEFADRFPEYCRQKMAPDEKYVSLLLPTNLQWLRAYEYMRTNGVLPPDNAHTHDRKRILEHMQRRLDYEVFYEYGKRCEIGRTLGKSLCSTLSFNLTSLDKAAQEILQEAQNTIGELHNLKLEDVKNIIAGFFYHLKCEGALSNMLNDILAVSGSKYNLIGKTATHISLNPWIPDSLSHNLPAFLSERPNEKNGFVALADTNSWYTKWFSGYTEFYAPYVRRQDLETDLLRILVTVLPKYDILKAYVDKRDKGTKVISWGINSHCVTVSDHVARLTCDQCGSSISVAQDDLPYWDNCHCLNANCTGHLHLDTATSGDDYYNRLYNSGNLVRIFAREHTGLLAREDREKLEADFKQPDNLRKPWDANLLSCTPTLEMGIDIGDLSTVVLCSVPPGQSQYIQRVGRAGRKDGNALAVTVANSQPHDLYFYGEPLSMLQGAITPPKVFLRASAVLERQFTAFAMDTWVNNALQKKERPENLVPRNMAPCLANMKKRSNKVFPFNFLNYVQSNIRTLQRKFLESFKGDLDVETIAELEQFITGKGVLKPPMHNKLLRSFENLYQQREALRKNIKQLKVQIAAIEAQPADSSHDEELRELRNESAAYLDIVQSIGRKDIFNFLSDESLLPNYAFPEAGITLRAILYRKDEEKEGTDAHKYEKHTYEYKRAASSAISEFAPANTFYAEGHKLTIDQVDMSTAELEKWRLCPNCSHAEKVVEDERTATTCPRCGSALWGDKGQIVNMLKVQMLYSSMNLKDSLIGEETESRRPKFYCKDLLVDVDESKDIEKAFELKDAGIPFGYEFVKKATLREINFGEMAVQGTKMMVAGKEAVRTGFRVCRYCGKLFQEHSAGSDYKKKENHHAYVCKVRHSAVEPADAYVDCLFLYREFVTEALRILIPTSSYADTTVRRESFVAAFMLGMKEYFGNVDHLGATVSEVPVGDGTSAKEYLVIYDTVPGGTGYLKQLMHSATAMSEIFAKALSVLKNCTCQFDQAKDGCYRCLYAYRQSRNIGKISRKLAIEMLEPIVTQKDKFVEIDKIGSIIVNSLFDSDLERQFIAALNSKFELKLQIINGKEGYRFIAKDQNNKSMKPCVWDVEPQVYLSAQDGVVEQCKPDFVLWPRGILHEPNATVNQKPIAIFTDGFTFHFNKVDDDTMKRMAIAKSGKFRVWSLSWDDVKTVLEPRSNFAAPLLDKSLRPWSQAYLKVASALHNTDFKLAKESFAQLIQYLQNPDAEQAFINEAAAQSVTFLDQSASKNGMDKHQWFEHTDSLVKMLGFDDFPQENTALIGTTTIDNVPIFASVDQHKLNDVLNKDKFNNAIILLCLLDDRAEAQDEGFKKRWNGFWQLANIMQFVKGFYPLTKSGEGKSLYVDLIEEFTPKAEDMATAVIPESPWQEIFEQICDDIALQVAKELAKRGFNILPTVGYELTNTDGMVLAQAEMAWEKSKIAFVLDATNQAVFVQAGWQVYLDQTILNNKEFKEV